MKLAHILTIAVVASTFTFTVVSCKEEKGPAAKVGDKIDDALDNRPAEGIRDKVEEIKK